MKKISFLPICMTLFCAAWLVSCSNSPLDKLNAFVDRTEKEAVEYTTEEWETSEEKFEQIMEDLKENYDEMTDEERKETLQTIGRYYGIQTKQGIKSAADKVGKAFESLPALLKGFSGGLQDDEE